MHNIKGIFERSILQDRASAQRDWRKAVEWALELYEGRGATRDIIDPGDVIKQKTWNMIEPFIGHLNVSKMIADKIGGGLYETTPTRTIDKDGPMVDALREAWQYDPVYTELDQVFALRWFVGSIALVVAWNDLLQEVEIIPLTPHQYRIIQNPRHPNVMDAFLYTFSQSETTDTTPKIYTKIIDPDGWKIVEGDFGQSGIWWKDSKTIDSDTHPKLEHVRIPVIHSTFNKSLTLGTVYGNGHIAELANANIIINLLLAALRVQTKNQALSQLAVKNISEEDFDSMQIGAINSVFRYADKRVGADNTTLPAELKYIAPNADLGALQKMVETEVGSIFARFGIRNQNPVQIQMGSPESGIAKWLAEAEVRGQQTKQIPSSMRVEKELAHYWMVAYCTGKKIALPGWLKSWDYAYGVKYAEARPTFTIQEQVIWDQHRLDNGVITALNLIIETYPDITDRDDALKKYRELEEERKSLVTPAVSEPREGLGAFDKLL